MRIRLSAILLVVSAAVWSEPLTCRGAETQTERLHRLFEDAWEFELAESPVFATRYGDHRWDDQLSRESVADQIRRLARRREFLARLQQIDRAQLSRLERINYDIFERQLRDEIAEADARAYLMAITNRSGFHISFPELPQDWTLRTTRDYENYIARLRAFARHADDHIELLREGIRQRLVLPSVVMDGYEGTITAHIVDDPSRSLLFSPFRAFPASVPAADRQRLTEAGREAIERYVVPSYAKFLAFMKQEYGPACRGSISVSELPGGRDYYRHRVKMFTTLDLTPEQVHETGQAEVRRIRSEMEAVMASVGFTAGFAPFVEHLRTEPRFYAASPEALLKEVTYVLKRMDGELPRLFKTLPRTPYGIREIPAYIAPRTTTAYYQPPAGDGSQAGFYFVNTFHLKSRPLYEIEALSFHEAVPGHHLQIAIQQELTGLPPFRRFAGITAFVEGWGLYAEQLGRELGFYQDPYSDFGRLTYEMWRACRLVVDTGMHYFGWTREQAIQFMADNTALSMHNITAEVDRYISWPGQALAYKTGELKIRELRALAERELASRFDVREFHDVVLGSGAVPLMVLEENVREYIAAARREGG
jgi:uncharacterized protein (DUF885 family)